MGRPKTEHYLIKKIDAKLNSFIMDFDRKNGIGNFRKASEELVEWIYQLEENANKQKKGKY